MRRRPVTASSRPTRRSATPCPRSSARRCPTSSGSFAPSISRCIELDGYEADDLIATLARKAEPAGFTTYMVTPDKDFGQLVTEHILQYRPSRMGDNPETLGVAEVLAKWGIERVDQVRDILGFSGDSSDNIPGVPGVGPKTAQKLVAQYGTLENALDHAAEQKGKLGESLVKFREQALLSKRLVTIDTEAPIPFEPDQLLIGPRDDEALKAIFTEFEFNTLGRRLFGEDFKAGRGFAPGEAAAGTLGRSDAPAEPSPLRAPAHGDRAAPAALARRPAPHARGHEARLSGGRPAARHLRERKDARPRHRSRCQGKVRGIGLRDQGGRSALSSPAENAVSFGKDQILIGHDLKPGLRALLRQKTRRGASRHLRYRPGPLAGLSRPAHTLDFVAESMLGYTPMAAPAVTGQQDFLATLESGLRRRADHPPRDGAGRSRAATARRARAAPEGIGAGTRLLRDRVAAHARAGRDGKRGHPARSRRAGRGRPEIARGANAAGSLHLRCTPARPSTSARPSSWAKFSSANSR